MRPTIVSLVLVLLFSAPALGEGNAPARSGPPAPAATFTLAGGAIQQAVADLDGDGEVGVTRLLVRPGLDVFFSPALQASFSLGASLDCYDFRGDDGLAGAEPFDDVRGLRLSTFARYALDDEWTLIGGPSLRMVAESGADLTDGASFGFLGGAVWKATETLSIGPGLGFFTEIEDDPVVFPFLLIDWRFADGWSIGTGRGLGATAGPGLTLGWDFAESWTLELGARWERLRFRLDDDPVAPDGVGQDEAIPVLLALTWKPTRETSVSLFAGMRFRGRLTVFDDGGKKLLREDYDPAPFFGLGFSLRF